MSGSRRWVAALLLAAASLVAAHPADARCVHSGQIYSCVAAGGKTIMMSCYGGRSGVMSCIDFNGKTLLVGQHWRNQGRAVPDSASEDDPSADIAAQLAAAADAAAADAYFDAQLSTALTADAAASRGTASRTADSTKRTQQQRGLR